MLEASHFIQSLKVEHIIILVYAMKATNLIFFVTLLVLMEVQRGLCSGEELYL